MKKLRIISLSLMLVFMLSLASVSAAMLPENSSRLQVTGNALVTAAPDTAQIVLGVETSSFSADQAAAENAQRLAKVFEALKELGIQDSEISTSGYNIYSHNNTYVAGVSEQNMDQITYNVQNRITITTKNLEDVGKIVDTAVKAGANQVQGISFDLADKQEMQLQALNVAIKQAMAKAEIMAKSAGVALGGIASIHEEYGTYVARNEDFQMKVANYDLGVATSINPGDVEVTVQVTMEYWF